MFFRIFQRRRELIIRELGPRWKLEDKNGQDRTSFCGHYRYKYLEILVNQQLKSNNQNNIQRIYKYLPYNI